MKEVNKDLYTNPSFVDDVENEILRKELDLMDVETSLELGCCEGEISSVLEKMGIEAWAVDLREYEFPLENFIRGDFLDVELPENYFDIAIDVSAIHHFGLATAYGGKRDLDGDIVSAKKVFNCLKPGGYFYLIMDRFKTEFDPDIQDLGFVRQYNLEAFKSRLCENFKIIEMKYYDYLGNDSGLALPTLEVVYAKLQKPKMEE